MTLEEMRAKAKALLDSMTERKAQKVADGSEMTAVELEAFNKDMDEYELLQDQIATQERLDKTFADAEKRTTAKTMETTTDKDKDPEKRTRYEVGETKREKFRSFGEFLVAVMVAESSGRDMDKRLTRAVTGLSEGVPSDGGFLVQQDFQQELLKEAYDTGILASRCRQITISSNSNSMKINGIDETSRATGSRAGGIRGYWLDEAGEKTASKPKFRQIELNLKKLIGLCYATDELLADAAALESVIRNGFASEFGWLIDDAIINGSGAGQPLGIMGGGSIVQVNKESGQTAATIVYENIVKMWARIFAMSRPTAVWLINQDTEPQLHTMSLAVGSGGLPVYLPAGGASAAPYATLYGRPVIPIEQCKTLGTAGDIILADFNNGYILAEKGGVKADVSLHVRFVYDESVFRFVMRVDGQPVRATTMTPANGSATQAHFVRLQSRT